MYVLPNCLTHFLHKIGLPNCLTLFLIHNIDCQYHIVVFSIFLLSLFYLVLGSLPQFPGVWISFFFFFLKESFSVALSWIQNFNTRTGWHHLQLWLLSHFSILLILLPVEETKLHPRNVSYNKPFNLSLFCCHQYFTSEYNSTYSAYLKIILKTEYVLKFKKESFWIV